MNDSFDQGGVHAVGPMPSPAMDVFDPMAVSKVIPWNDSVGLLTLINLLVLPTFAPSFDTATAESQIQGLLDRGLLTS